MTENRFNGAINRYNYALTLADMTVTSSKRNGNLTFNDILYLNMIRYISDCTASKIADAAHVAKSSVTVKINSLCDRGLVVRKRSEDDGRVWYLGLSPGVEETFVMEDAMLSDAFAILMEKYSNEDLEMFCDILEEISTGLQEACDTKE